MKSGPELRGFPRGLCLDCFSKAGAILVGRMVLGLLGCGDHRRGEASNPDDAWEPSETEAAVPTPATIRGQLAASGYVVDADQKVAELVRRVMKG